MDNPVIVLLFMTLVILAAVAVLLVAMHGKRRVRELEHAERLAMIDRGLVPPPEVDPEAFDRSGIRGVPESRSAARWRSAGITMIGFGAAFFFLMGFAVSQVDVGLGLGGAFATMGGAFLINSRLIARSDAAADRRETFSLPRTSSAGFRGGEPPSSSAGGPA